MPIKSKILCGFVIRVQRGSGSSNSVTITTPDGEKFENLSSVRTQSIYFPKWSSALFIVLGLLLGVLACWYFVQYRNIEQNWKSAAGRVEAITQSQRSASSKSKTKSRIQYVVQFRFSDLSGAGHSFERTYESAPRFQQGSEVQVIFDPANLSNMRLKTDVQERVVAIVLLLFSLCFTVTGIIVLILGPFDRVLIVADGLRWQGSHTGGVHRVA